MHKSIYLRSALLLVICSVILCCPVVLSAQTASPTPAEKSEEEKRLEEEKRISQLKKEIAENKKAELAAQFPPPTSTPLAGQTTVNDGAVIESQMIAYFAMGKVADTVVSGITKKVGKNNLAIFNSQDVNALLGYKITRNQIGIIRQGYCRFLNTDDPKLCPASASLTPESLATFATIGRSLLGGFVDLTSFLRTNVEIKGTTFDIEEGPFAAEIFRSGRRTIDGLESVNLYYPAMFPPKISPESESKVLGEIDELYRLRTLAEQTIGRIEEQNKAVKESEGKIKTLESSIKQLTEQIRDLENTKNNLNIVYCSSRRGRVRSNPNEPCASMPPAVKERFLNIQEQLNKLVPALAKANADSEKEEQNKKVQVAELKMAYKKLKSDSSPNPSKFQLEDIIAQVKSRNVQFDKLVESLVAPSAAGVNGLTSFIKAESYLNALPANSYWLQIKVIKAGGNNRIKTNLVLDIFRGGNRISHSGGVIAQYILFDGEGNVVSSDVITEYVDYIKSKKIKSLK